MFLSIPNRRCLNAVQLGAVENDDLQPLALLVQFGAWRGFMLTRTSQGLHRDCCKDYVLSEWVAHCVFSCRYAVSEMKSSPP